MPPEPGAYNLLMSVHVVKLFAFIGLAAAALSCVSADRRKASACARLRPAIVTGEEWGSKAHAIPDSRRQTPAWVTLHHAGVPWTGKDPAQFVRDMQVWGQNRPMLEKPPMNTYWPDLPYHYLIAPDGRIFEGRDVRYEPESNTKYPLSGNIGVEMMGDFNVQPPTQEQLRSSVRVVAWLSCKHGITLDHVRGHRDAAPGQTDCPGKGFYRHLEDGGFRRWVEAVGAGKEAGSILQESGF